jgi:hypothetical protein
MRKAINPLLLALFFLDVFYVLVILFFPSGWFDLIHGMPYVDPGGLLRRTAAMWASFAVFQAVALMRWQREPHWLMLVSGIRTTEVVSDWVYLLFAKHVTWFGRAALLMASPINMFCAWFFYAAYLRYFRSVPLQVGQAGGQRSRTPDTDPPEGPTT